MMDESKDRAPRQGWTGSGNRMGWLDTRGMDGHTREQELNTRLDIEHGLKIYTY